MFFDNEGAREMLGRTLDYIAAGALSAFGGAAAYVYGQTRRGDKFRLGPFCTNAILAFFVGQVLGSFLPEGMPGRDGLVMMAGFCSFPALAVFEIYFLAWLRKRAQNMTGVEEQDLEAARKDVANGKRIHDMNNREKKDD